MVHLDLAALSVSQGSPLKDCHIFFVFDQPHLSLLPHNPCIPWATNKLGDSERLISVPGGSSSPCPLFWDELVMLRVLLTPVPLL